MEAILAGLLNEFPGWLDKAEVKAMLDPARATPEDDGPDPLAPLMALPAEEQARREKERLSRELRRATLAQQEVERGSAWPRAEHPAPADRPTQPKGPKKDRLSTRPLVPSQWRLEAVRETAWTSDEAGATADTAAQPAPPRPPEPVESAADRLARIRARRAERRFPMPPPRPGRDPDEA